MAPEVYAALTVPAGKPVGLTPVMAPLTTRVNALLTVAFVGVALSVAVSEKGTPAVFAVVGVPLTTPVLALRFNPAGRAPVVIVQV
jgi:hypothetical protein